MTQNVGFGVFERYGDLKRETGLLNRLTDALIPSGEFKPSVKYAAHHIIEDRTYAAFAKDWQLLGWNSADDMMTTAISYEAHTYSPKKGALPGLPADPDALESLTARLKKTIGEPTDYKSADDLIDAYIDFYRQPSRYKGTELAGATQTNRVVDVLKATKKELQAARSRARLIELARKRL